MTEIAESQPEETSENADADSQLNNSSNSDCEQLPETPSGENNENHEQVSEDQHGTIENEILNTDKDSEQELLKDQLGLENLFDDENIDFRLMEDDDLGLVGVNHDDENVRIEDAETDIVVSTGNEEDPETLHAENVEVEDNTQSKDNDSNPNENETSNTNNDADQDNNEPSAEDEPAKGQENTTFNGQNESIDNETDVSDFIIAAERKSDIQNDVSANGTELDAESESELNRKRKRSVIEKENLNTSNSSGDPKVKRVRFAPNLNDEQVLLSATEPRSCIGQVV